MTPKNSYGRRLDQILENLFIHNEEYQSEYRYIHQLEWNPMLLSIFYGKKEIVDYLNNDLKVHLKSSISISKCSSGPSELSASPLLFCFVCALLKPEDKTQQKIFKDLWQNNSYLWDYHCVKNTLIMSIIFRRDDLFDFILRSKLT